MQIYAGEVGIYFYFRARGFISVPAPAKNHYLDDFDNGEPVHWTFWIIILIPMQSYTIDIKPTEQFFGTFPYTVIAPVV